MAQESVEEIEREVMAAFRTAMTGAARMGEHLARMREQQKRAAEASSQQASRELAARFSTEARTAEIQLRPVMDDRWWEHAGHDHVASMYQTAAAWREHSPVAQDAAFHMSEEIRRRYGVDIGGSDPATVAERLDRSAATRDQAPDTERDNAGEERAHGYRRIADADRADRATANSENAPTGRDGHPGRDDPQSVGAPAYDSAQRRTMRAAELGSVTDEETVEAQMVADHCQATPATEAVLNGGPRRAPTARKAGPGTSRDRSRQQAGR